MVKCWLITNSLGMLAYSLQLFKFFQDARMSHLLPPSVFSDTWYYYFASSYGLYQVQFHFILVVRPDSTWEMAEIAFARRVGPIEQYVHYPRFQPSRSSSFFRGSERPLPEDQFLRWVALIWYKYYFWWGRFCDVDIGPTTFEACRYMMIWVWDGWFCLHAYASRRCECRGRCTTGLYVVLLIWCFVILIYAYDGHVWLWCYDDITIYDIHMFYHLIVHLSIYFCCEWLIIN